MRFLNTFAAMRTVASFRRRKTIHRNAWSDLREAGARRCCSAQASEQEAAHADPGRRYGEREERVAPFGATTTKDDVEFAGERQPALWHGDARRHPQRGLRVALRERTS